MTEALRRLEGWDGSLETMPFAEPIPPAEVLRHFGLGWWDPVEDNDPRTRPAAPRPQAPSRLHPLWDRELDG